MSYVVAAASAAWDSRGRLSYLPQCLFGLLWPPLLLLGRLGAEEREGPDTEGRETDGREYDREGADGRENEREGTDDREIEGRETADLGTDCRDIEGRETCGADRYELGMRLKFDEVDGRSRTARSPVCGMLLRNESLGETVRLRVTGGTTWLEGATGWAGAVRVVDPERF